MLLLYILLLYISKTIGLGLALVGLWEGNCVRARVFDLDITRVGGFREKEGVWGKDFIDLDIEREVWFREKEGVWGRDFVDLDI